MTRRSSPWLNQMQGYIEESGLVQAGLEETDTSGLIQWKSPWYQRPFSKEGTNHLTSGKIILFQSQKGWDSNLANLWYSKGCKQWKIRGKKRRWRGTGLCGHKQHQGILQFYQDDAWFHLNWHISPIISRNKQTDQKHEWYKRVMEHLSQLLNRPSSVHHAALVQITQTSICKGFCSVPSIVK